MNTGSTFLQRLQIFTAIFILFSVSACQSTVTSISHTPLPTATATSPVATTTPSPVSSPYLQPIATFPVPNDGSQFTSVVSPDGTRMIFITYNPPSGKVTTMLWNMTPPVTQIATIPTIHYWGTVNWLSDSSMAILQDDGEDTSETVDRNGIVDMLPNTHNFQTFLQPSPDSKYVASTSGNDNGAFAPFVIVPIDHGAIQVQNAFNGASGWILGWLGDETIVYINQQFHLIEENLAQHTRADLGTIPNFLPAAPGNTSPDGTVLVSVPFKAPNFYWITKTGFHQTRAYFATLNWISNHTMLVFDAALSIDGSTGVATPTKTQLPPSQGTFYPASSHWVYVSDRAVNTLSLEDINTGQLFLIGTFPNFSLSNTVQSTQYFFYDNKIYKVLLPGQ